MNAAAAPRETKSSPDQANPAAELLNILNLRTVKPHFQAIMFVGIESTNKGGRFSAVGGAVPYLVS